MAKAGKIYPQSITGKYRTRRNLSLIGLLFVYFACSWIRWTREAGAPTQAIFMDLPGRRAYFFGIEIWPEEVYYITGILILAALGLFFVTSLFGRIWCGYTCPHSVYVDLFIKVEKFFQGDRNTQMRLDRKEMDRDKLLRKLATHASWMAIGFTFAFGWVCYFYDAPTLVKDIASFQVTSGGLSWLIGLTLSTYLFAGYVRQRVCMYMCPYGRFQSAMLDNDTSVVTYHDWRGEPRGKFNPNDKSLGDCIDCNKCVVVCPMGIDIRDGLQMECIGCGLCIDACNSVMDQLDRPRYLIGYDSFNSTEDRKLGRSVSRKVFQMKTVLFASIFLVVSSLILYSLLTKASYTMAIIRERGPLMTILPDGSVRNTYNIKLTNKTSHERELTLMVRGMDEDDPLMKVQGRTPEYTTFYKLDIDPDEEIELKVFVKVAEDEIDSHQKPIQFEFTDDKTNEKMSKSSIFVMTK